MPQSLTDPLLVVLAIGLATLVSNATLGVAVELGAARPRRTIPLAIQCALVLALGFCATAAVESLAIGLPDWSRFEPLALVSPFALAVLSALSALLLVAYRPADRVTAPVAALALGTVAIPVRWVALTFTPSTAVSSADWPWIDCSACLVFLGFAAGLSQAPRRRRERTWRAPLVHATAVTLLAAGTLASDGGALLSASPLARRCCAAPALIARLLALALAAVAGAMLVVTHVIAVYRGKLGERATRSAREIGELHARLQHAATHDALTGLPNRHLLKERLARSFGDSQRPERTIAVAMLDLDRFSALNHSLGHGVGDRLLAEIARRLEAAVSAEHMLARVGGDEFAVLIDHVAARVEANTVTCAIAAALERPLLVNGEEVRVRPSIGVSIWPDDARRGDDLLAHAEAALRIAKQAGGSQVQFFRPGMSDSMQERIALENDLRRALAAGEFEIHYQPQLSSKTGRILAIEALVRWRHPTKGLITPSSFVPLAEQTGLIVALDELVLREVCRQTRAWQVDTGTHVRVAVNLSAAQFRRPNILEVIRRTLEAASLDARALEIELTESTLMGDLEDSAAALKQLRAMGISIAIDDFGTGYSSLSYLRRLPIDKLKIDRSFIRDITSSRTDALIVRAIISLAHSVGLQVVAEGVETAEHLEFIRSLDCDQWQGFYCCQPQPSAAIEEMLMERGTTRTGIVAALARASRRFTP